MRVRPRVLGCPPPCDRRVDCVRALFHLCCAVPRSLRRAVRLYDGKTGQLNKTLWPNGRAPSQPKPGQMPSLVDESPVMAMRCHPKVAGKLRVASTNGTIELYDVKQGNSKATTQEPKGQQTMSIDYNGA